MDPITLTSTALPVLRTLGSHVDLILTVANWFYHAITDARPIIDDPNDPNYKDKTRYNRLVLARKTLTGVDYIPEQWTLEASTSKPTKKILFSENIDTLKQNVHDLNECSYQQKLITIGLLTTIESIFGSSGLNRQNPNRA